MQSKAQAVWEGDLMSGKGRVSSRTSGVIRDAGLSWKARTESAGANTNPEELLAASHASCFAMALSNGLAKAGSLRQLGSCSAPGWYIEGGVCYPARAADGLYGWRIDSRSAR